MIRKRNAYQIKLFMAFLMVLDHLPHIPGLVSSPWEGIFHALTRCVAVWFAYMAVEGFLHTRNRLRYNARLFLWAGVMAAGNFLLNRLFSGAGVEIHNNIFLTLALGELMLNVLFTPMPGDSHRTQRQLTGWFVLRIAGAAGAATLAVCLGEGAHVVLPFMLITYVFRSRVRTRNLLCLAYGALLLWMAYVPYPTAAETVDMLLFNCDGLFITVLPFLALYNGERGPQTKFSKYFFYGFYPAHLWIITIIAYFVAR